MKEERRKEEKVREEKVKEGKKGERRKDERCHFSHAQHSVTRQTPLQREFTSCFSIFR